MKSTVACPITEYNIIIWENFIGFALSTEYLDVRRETRIYNYDPANEILPFGCISF